MDNTGTIKTAVSLPIDLWNKTRKIMDQEGIINFSYFVQKSLRLNIKMIERKNIKEFVEVLNDREFELLKKEIKKRG